MRTATAARIGWLFPPDREVYQTHRTPREAPGTIAACHRCGGAVSQAGSGTRAPVYFLTRDRGSERRSRSEGAIHRGCIPEPGRELQRVRARALHASQVRA